MNLFMKDQGRVLEDLAQRFVSVLFLTIGIALTASGQNPTPTTDAAKKANTRPPESAQPKTEPYDGASIEKMTGQCVTLETEHGTIVIEVLPSKAPETVRNFLNLSATGAFNTTTFARVVRGFVIQGGALSTSEKWSSDLAARAARRLPDEPNDLKHVRGVVSMARGEEANSASTHFFILIGDAPHLDSKFAGFGRVVSGMEAADAINKAPTEGEKPTVPVRINHATVAACPK